MFVPTYFFIQVVYKWKGSALVPSVITAPLSDDLKCNRNSAKSDIWYIAKELERPCRLCLLVVN